MRSLMRRLAAFTSPELFSDGERAAAEDLIQACTLVHGWIMTSYLRGGLCRSSAPIDEMQEALLRAALGVEEEAEEGGGGEARTDAAEPAPAPSPYLWISATAMGVSQRLPGLTDQERIAMDDLLTTVAADLAKCEKLVSTPIPLGYTRSSVRRLVAARWPPEIARDYPRSPEHELGRRSDSSGSGSRCCLLPSRARSPTSKPARGGRTSRSPSCPCC